VLKARINLGHADRANQRGYQMRKMLVLLVLLLGFQQGAAAQEPAGASAYLVGVFDLRGDRRTLLHIVNPTADTLILSVTFFDHDEKPLHCERFKLSANDLEEVDVGAVLLGANVGTLIGVVKVASFIDENQERPQIGVIGNQRLELGRQSLTETGLHPIQMRFLEAGLPIIRQLCRG
jgi:hypothetical protein